MTRSFLVDATAVARAPVPSGQSALHLEPPVSKSDAQRALALAHAIGDPGLVHLPPDDLLPRDVGVLRRGLAVLREHPGEDLVIDCQDGGAPFRILLGQAATTAGARVRFTGTPRLAERPHGPLTDALLAALTPAGLRLEHGAPWPLVVHGAGRAIEARFAISSEVSSQFVTSLLLAAAGLVVREGRPWRVELRGPVASAGYLELTLDWLRRMGFSLDVEPGAVTVTGGERPSGAISVPGDWSSLAYLLLVGWRTGAAVGRVDRRIAHPDRAILDVLAEAGLTVDDLDDHDDLHDRGSAVKVRGEPIRGVHASGRTCPDLLPTVAALACVLPSASTITDVSILRHKESDRLAGVEELVRAGGGHTRLRDDTLTIEPGRVPARITLASRHDHRMVMSATVLAALAGATLVIDDVACVEKSFPSFWIEMAKVGVKVRVGG